MNKEQLVRSIKDKKSFLCIGLDTDKARIPRHLLSEEDPVFTFNMAIIDATHDLAVAYKPNVAFYESHGPAGMLSLERTVNYLKEISPPVFTIADAKRGDIGNTCDMYATAFYDHYGFDAITLAPYMGEDSVKPFLKHEGKWSIILALTSNPSYSDFQVLNVGDRQSGDDTLLYEKVLRTSREWGTESNIMYVVGATRADWLSDIRKIVPGHFLLVPGVGSQGGSLKEVVEHGMNSECGLLINASRSILYASANEDFAAKAREEALVLQQEMADLLAESGISSK